MSNTIGIIGLGSMGHAMAECLLKAGYDLKVYNRTPLPAQNKQKTRKPVNKSR